MSVFSEAEVAFLSSQRLGRLATLGGDGALHVVPVGYRYNAERDTIDIGGWGFGQSKKFRDAARYGRVAFVVDDAPAPRELRGVEVRGAVQVERTGGEQAIRPGADPEFIRIVPQYIASWGLDTDSYTQHGRPVRQDAEGGQHGSNGA